VAVVGQERERDWDLPLNLLLPTTYYLLPLTTT
jgi:hypothetical protein